jgi:hypothetical protein
MSRTNKSIVFLTLTFAISWAVAIGGHYAGLAHTLGGTTILIGMMAGPAVAALICSFAFEKGRRAEALGLRFAPNWWWLAAWATPILLALGSVAFTLLLSDRAYADLGQSIVAAIEKQAPEHAAQVRAIPNLGLIQLEHF